MLKQLIRRFFSHNTGDGTINAQSSDSYGQRLDRLQSAIESNDILSLEKTIKESPELDYETPDWELILLVLMTLDYNDLKAFEMLSGACKACPDGNPKSHLLHYLFEHHEYMQRAASSRPNINTFKALYAKGLGTTYQHQGMSSLTSLVHLVSGPTDFPGSYTPIGENNDEREQAIEKLRRTTRLDILAFLIEQGHDINTVQAGVTPMYYAVKDNDEELVNLLLANNADPQSESDLFSALRSNTKPSITQKLLEHGYSFG